MTTPHDPPGPLSGGERLPSREQVQALARDLLAGEGTRLQHVRTAGLVATRLSVLFDAEDGQLLITAATLHDIGYSARIAHTGFHPLDGAAFLRAQGYPERLAGLVAHHSLATPGGPPNPSTPWPWSCTRPRTARGPKSGRPRCAWPGCAPAPTQGGTPTSAPH